MARTRVWIGSQGPYYFDDTDQFALRTEGQIYLATTPTSDNHGVRLTDLGNLTGDIMVGTNHKVFLTDDKSVYLTCSGSYVRIIANGRRVAEWHL